MKKTLLIIMMMAMLVLGMVYAQDITSPNGGENYTVGDTVTITYTEAVDTGNITYDLGYSDDGGGSWNTIRENYTDYDTQIVSAFCEGQHTSYDFHAMDYDPNFPDLIWVGNSDDGGQDYRDGYCGSNMTLINITDCNMTCLDMEIPYTYHSMGGMASFYNESGKFFILGWDNDPIKLYDENMTYIRDMWNYDEPIVGFDCYAGYCYGLENDGSHTIHRWEIGTWTHVSKSVPSGTRIAYGLVAIGNDMLIFGGVAGYKDLYLYDFSTNTYRRHLEDKYMLDDSIVFAPPNKIYGMGYPEQGTYNFEINITELFSYSWDTTGVTPSNDYQVRVRYEDEDTTGSWDASDGNFSIVECYDNGDCGLCEKCSAGFCVNQTSAEDLKGECSQVYDSCTNDYIRLGDSGNCDGAGACGNNDAELNVSDGNVCYNGNDDDPNATTYCGIWSDCVENATTALEYYIGYLGDGTATCSDTDWKATGTQWNATLYFVINATIHADECTEVCVPDWNCNLYGDCNVSDLRPCIDAVDNHSCGYSYTGNYTEFTPQACDYCTPDWYCANLQGDCPPSKIKNCLNIGDNNNCYAQTGLGSDNFTGNLSDYNRGCGFQSVYTTQDFRDMVVDFIGTFGMEIIATIGIIVIAGLVGFVGFRVVKFGRMLK